MKSIELTMQKNGNIFTEQWYNRKNSSLPKRIPAVDIMLSVYIESDYWHFNIFSNRDFDLIRPTSINSSVQVLRNLNYIEKIRCEKKKLVESTNAIATTKLYSNGDYLKQFHRAKWEKYPKNTRSTRIILIRVGALVIEQMVVIAN